jgi:hypothetical protein
MTGHGVDAAMRHDEVTNFASAMGRLRLQSPNWWAIQDSNLKPTD